MGDRANVRVNDGDNKVYLYTHWSGSDLPAILQAALKRGKGRWDDTQYLTRVIFCEMVKDDILGDTGYGISVSLGDGGDRVLDIRGTTITTSRSGKSWTFEQYLMLNKDDLEKVWDK